MNKNLIYVAVAVIVLILIGGGAFAYLNMNKATVPLSPVSQTSDNSQSNITPEPPQPPTNLKSLKDLLAAGVSQKCTFADTSAASVSGTTYLSAGKIRGDFATAAGGGHMIVDGKTSFMWMDGQKTGFKMTFDLEKIATGGATQQGIDVTKAMDYNCSAWTTDTSMFTPPATIKFTDFGTIKTPPPGTPQSNCSACDYLSGDSKTQCRAALKCN